MRWGTKGSQLRMETSVVYPRYTATCEPVPRAVRTNGKVVKIRISYLPHTSLKVVVIWSEYEKR
jgi:hypothetical protein